MQLAEFMKIFALRFDVGYNPDNEGSPYDVLIPDLCIINIHGEKKYPLGTDITFDTAVSALIMQINESKRVVISINGTEREFPIPQIESL